MPATIVLLVGLSYINPIALLLFTTLTATYAILYWGFFDQVHKRGLEVGNTSTKRNQFLIEMTAKMRAIRECGAQYVWLDRFREISANATMAGFRAEQISSFLVSISYFLMMAAAILIVALTTPAVLNQSLASGVLVASMMLMWRVLNPIQTVFVSMSRIERVRGAVRQIDALMAIQGERTENTMPPVERGMKGKIEFARVSFRYTTHADPALTGVEFRIEPGKMVAISGANGGGKSTVLKLMLGLYQPQAGSVLIDNVDIRQLDSFELRRLIGYAPQDLHLFRASIAQNLRLARPDATDNEIYQALDMAGALEQTLALQRGLDFRVGDNTDDIPATLRHKIILARAYITRAPIMLFDEPGAGLDEIGEFKFIKALEMLKGKATVVYISHSPKHIMMADTLMVFDKGFLRAAAPPADLLKPPAPPANPD
jgi:ATP-binding cassette subfamily B protein